MFVPCLIIIGGYELKVSQKLSYCILAGNYFSQFLVNCTRTQVDKPTRPVISYEIALFYLPILLAGNKVGGILNEIFPNPVLYIIAMFVVIICSYLTYLKGLLYYRVEEELKVRSLYDHSSLSIGSHHLFHSILSEIEGREHSDSKSLSIHQSLKSMTQDNQLMQSLIAPDTKGKDLKLPIFVILLLLGMWIIYVTIQVLIEIYKPACNEPTGIFLFIIVFPLLFATSYLAVNFLRNKQIQFQSLNISSNSSSIEGDLDLSQSVIIPTVLIFVVGVMCNVLGLGGSELSLPLLLYLNVPAPVASSTAPYMSLLSNGSNVIIYSVNGNINWSAGFSLVLVGFIGGILGRTQGLEIVKKWNRQSALIFCLASILFMTCFFYVYELVTNPFDAALSSYC